MTEGVLWPLGTTKISRSLLYIILEGVMGINCSKPVQTKILCQQPTIVALALLPVLPPKPVPWACL